MIYEIVSHTVSPLLYASVRRAMRLARWRRELTTWPGILFSPGRMHPSVSRSELPAWMRTPCHLALNSRSPTICDTLRQDTTVNRDRSRRSDVKVVMRTASDKEIRLSEQDSTLRVDTINTHPPDIAVRKASTAGNLLSIIKWTFATILAITLLVLILKFAPSRP